MVESYISAGNLLLAIIATLVVGVAWGVRVEMRGRSNTHRLDTLDQEAKEDTKDWRRAQEKIDAKVDSVVKVTYLMAGKMGIDVPLD